MSDLADTAQRLRQVRDATRQFLALYALESVRERVRKGTHAADPDEAVVEAALSDFNNHDWSLLYRGSVLDD